MRRLLFLDIQPSVHSERLVTKANQLGFDMEFRTYDNMEIDRKAILFIGTVGQAPKNILMRPNYKVGISWSYDLYRNPNNCKSNEIRSFNLKMLDELIVDCNYVAKLAYSYGFKESNLVIMPYGVDLNENSFNMLERKKVVYPPTFYSNRSWEPGYGVDILLKAANFLLNSGTDFKLKLAGDGSLRKDLLAPYASTELASKLVYLGRVTTEQNSKHLVESDFFISASTADGISVSLLESMAMGTPVITSDIEPNKEIIWDRQNGFLFKNANAYDLARAMTAAISIQEEYGRIEIIKRSARETIEREADLLKNLKRVLNSIMDRAG